MADTLNPVLEVLKIIKNNHLSNDSLDLHFNSYMKNHAILIVGPKSTDKKQIEEAKIAERDARNSLFVLYSLLNMKPAEREQIISAVRRIREVDPYSEVPGELNINPAHIDSAVIYSVKEILAPKKKKMFIPKKGN